MDFNSRQYVTGIFFFLTVTRQKQQVTAQHRRVSTVSVCRKTVSNEVMYVLQKCTLQAFA